MDEGKEIVGRVPSADGVEIVYSTGGSGDAALVFIHGGLADRVFWRPQMTSLASRYQVVALDLAGHGESGWDRKVWTIPAFAGDVRAVADGLRLQRMVLIGNSVGGPVALEATRLLPGRVLGVVGVDTLHDATVTFDPAEAHAMAEEYRKDFAGACRRMVGSLFHPGSQTELHQWSEERMCATRPEVVIGLMEGLAGFDLGKSFRLAEGAVRAINGDLWPTNTQANRAVRPDFEVVVMSGAGHYPMLERPAEFNQLLVEIVERLPCRGNVRV